MLKALTLCADPIAREPVLRALAHAQIVEADPSELESLMETPMDPPPQLIVCGHVPEEDTLMQLAQGLSLTYQDAMIIYITTDRAGFDREKLKKNGFFDAFLVPFENAELQSSLSGLVTKFNAEATEVYRTVKLVDFFGTDALEFDTFIMLPLNRKHVKYTRAGMPLDPEKVAKLKSHDVSALHIKKEDTAKFYQFTAQQLINIGKDEALSETERHERIQNSVRAIVGDIFADKGTSTGFDSGRKLITDCQEIVKSYVSAAQSKEAKIYDKLMSLSEQGGVYSQASNTATFAALFATGLQIGKPEEVAMAGMLCDIGLADLPTEIQLLPKEKRTKEQERIYMSHGELTVRQLKAKRMVLSERVFDIILQHHEHWDGSGYPARLVGPKILPEAQIVGIAIEFAELLMAVPGRRRMSPREAIEHISSQAGGKRYEHALLFKLRTLLQLEETGAA